tara:strand:- start:305 stop:568 length:264 start_codon:yes stop_codon:yes gene_type:complete
MYLSVKECLNMEVAVGEKMYNMEDYQMRLKYQYYKMECGHFVLDAYHSDKFMCNISTKFHHICQVSMYQVNSTKEACLKAIELFKLK